MDSGLDRWPGIRQHRVLNVDVRRQIRATRCDPHSVDVQPGEQQAEDPGCSDAKKALCPERHVVDQATDGHGS